MLDNIRILEHRILKELVHKTKRYLYATVDFSSQMIGVVGARGVGKTTMLLQYTNELKSKFEPYKSLYFSYDHPSNSSIVLLELAEEFAKVGGEYLIIDEIHKYQNFAVDLKAIYDFLPRLKVVFTGSCATSIYSSRADLSRRVVLYNMYGLSYREFLELKLGVGLPSFGLEEILVNGVDISSEMDKKFVPLEHFAEYLQCGYYPFYFKEQREYLRQLNAIINLTIEIDLVNLGLVNIAFVNKLKKLLLLLSGSVPFELNITKVSSAIEVSRNTLYAYLHHLEKAGLLNIVTDGNKGISKLAKPEKLYLGNTNMFYAFGLESNVGTVRETFFVSQLKQAHMLNTTKNGDFIIDGKYHIEIGGNSKGFEQIRDIPDSYLAIDTDITQNNRKIPLWLFGFLY
mgnify:CR=1 FL=1